MPKNSQKRKKSPSIGTKNESSLHRVLKYQYSGSGGATETSIGDYICDAQTSEGEIIEVQTGSLGPLKQKAKDLARTGKVRIIHPIIFQKHIELYDAKGKKLLRKRKSPKKGSAWDLFNALIYAPELPLLKNLTIELVIADIVEKRVDDGSGSWRRRGVRIADHTLAALHQSIVLKKPKDYLQFIPFIKKEDFTVKDLSEKAKIDIHLARKTLYVLSKIGLVERIGKRDRAFIYRRK